MPSSSASPPPVATLSFPDAGLSPPRPARASAGARLLRRSATAWLLLAVLGQLVFAAYVTVFYGGAAASGDRTRWSEVLPHGFRVDRLVDTLAVAAHVLPAVIVLVGGTLQLWPALRRRWPAAHRWLGRTYFAAVALVTAAGVFMTLRRGTPHAAAYGALLNAAVISVSAVLAVRHARARNFDAHRRWALRLYLAALGVWFFRIGLMAWLLINQGPVGFDPQTLRGPAITVLAYAQTLVPLGVLELYLRARGGRARHAAALGLIALTVLTALGSFAASRILWLPHL